MTERALRRRILDLVVGLVMGWGVVGLGSVLSPGPIPGLLTGRRRCGDGGIGGLVLLWLLRLGGIRKSASGCRCWLCRSLRMRRGFGCLRGLGRGASGGFLF